MDRRRKLVVSLALIASTGPATGVVIRHSIFDRRAGAKSHDLLIGG
jgi:hypothetical protein